MAPKSSRRSEAPQPLVRTHGTLKKHWGLLGSDLQSLLGLSRQEIMVSDEIVDSGASAGLEGRACLRARRERGRPMAVIPLCDVGPEDLVVWAGFQEHWSTATANTFAFHHAGITVYLGGREVDDKYQMFRAEWAGFVDRGQGATFESPGAAHPHWQFDGIRHVSERSVAAATSLESLRARLHGEEQTQSFAPPATRTVMDVVRDFPVSRIHFALSASWWGKEAQHVRAPEDEVEIRRWTLACLKYIQSEMAKI